MKRSKQTQSFGDDPLAVRQTGHYKHEYVEGFVDKWDDLIDWKQRWESEGDFFIETLRSYGVERVLDVAAGTGFHSVRLLSAGFDVVSVDGSPEMLARGFDNAWQHGYILRTAQADWRWLSRNVNEKFDAIICLGNSFTHLFSEHDRRKTLAEYYACLKHDGILILDQRNYDAILDEGFSSTHKYYYCGEDVVAEPDHVDDGLARFQYTFPDGSQYYLNMFPLRRKYTRRLMQEVGFQNVETYGDFQETFRANDPDFLIHIAEKEYREVRPEGSGTNMNENYSEAVNIARDYYNNESADNFYSIIWGGEDIHVGLYKDDKEPISDASHRTVAHMASKLNQVAKLQPQQEVLDIGSGYGGAARYLASEFDSTVVALNLSEAENERARRLNAERKLDDKITVVDGDFENIQASNNQFDAIWSQDAMLHSGDREKVIQEVARVLKPGGYFIFTDPMQADDAPRSGLQPILDRLHLSSLGSPGFYREAARRYNMEEVEFEDRSDMLPRHYGRVLEETERQTEALAGRVSDEYIERMKKGLRHWVEGGDRGHLAWGIFIFRKKD